MNTSLILERLREPQVLKSVQVSLPISLAFIAGIAGCLHHWVVPIIRMGSSVSTKIKQFQLVITLGFRYLQPGGRIMGATLVGTAFLLYGHPDAAVAKLWRYYAIAAGILLPVAPWEEFLIFPTNNRILAFGHDPKTEGKDGVPEEQGERNEELNELLTTWQRWHLGRVLMPLGAAVVTALGLLDS